MPASKKVCVLSVILNIEWYCHSISFRYASCIWGGDRVTHKIAIPCKIPRHGFTVVTVAANGNGAVISAFARKS